MDGMGRRIFDSPSYESALLQSPIQSPTMKSKPDVGIRSDQDKSEVLQ